MLASTLARHRSKPRTFIGCMKSGSVLFDKYVKYHEPELMSLNLGNLEKETSTSSFRHATGQIYAISKDLATYISINKHILHKHANEDVYLGAWFIGLEVKHIDERNMCCGAFRDGVVSLHRTVTNDGTSKSFKRAQASERGHHCLVNRWIH